MRAEHVEAMEQTEATMREAGRRPGRNFGHSIVPPILGLGTIAGAIAYVALVPEIESASTRSTVGCGIPLTIVVALLVWAFIRDRV